MPELIPLEVSGASTGDKVALAYPGHLWGYLIGMPGNADATVTIYDNASVASGTKIKPTTTYDASALGDNGAMLPQGILAENGLTVSVTCTGSWTVTLYVH